MKELGSLATTSWLVDRGACPMVMGTTVNTIGVHYCALAFCPQRMVAP